MENALTVIKNIATVTGCGVSIFTFVGLTIKPLRKKIGDWFVKVTYREKIEEIDKRVKRIEDNDNKIQDLDKRLQDIEHNKQLFLDIAIKLDDISKKVTGNEADRLRGELFNCGNRCRRGLPLYADEFRYVQAVWKKYNGDLHENSIGEDEYKFIYHYFESPQNQELINKK